MTTAESPAAPEDATLEARTLHQWLCEPQLSTRARTLLSIVAPAIAMHGVCAIFRVRLAEMLGCCQREVSKTINELERWEIFKTHRGGQGMPRRLTFGRAVAFYGGRQSTSFIAFEEKRQAPSAGSRRAGVFSADRTFRLSRYSEVRRSAKLTELL
ncbi:MAG TPA: hypothetical protein VFA29_01185 [Candidatus Baltobacteraceae bacterium]|nr:hypothetical protein [Candidatus Baltobacteraceae bacterium]